MFNREQYSKEAFDQARRERDTAARELQKSERNEIRFAGGILHHPPYIEEYKKAYLLAQKRVDALANMAQKEGKEMNKEFDRLADNVKRAMEEFERFKREKLGMKTETQDS